jgi:hypothetical protein
VELPVQTTALTDLVWRHRPVVHYAEGEVAPATTVETMLQAASLNEWRQIQWGANHRWITNTLSNAPVSVAILDSYASQGFENLYVTYENPDHINQPPPGPPMVYSFVVDRSNYIFVQYWFFMGTSFIVTPIPDLELIRGHEGDWEMAQVAVKKEQSGGTLIPRAVTASQHYYGQTLRWDRIGVDFSSPNQDYVSRNGFRPDVYVAKNTHAIYFRPGDFAITPNLSGLTTDCQIVGIQYEICTSGCDQTEVNQTESGLPINPLESLLNRRINNWPGRWGWVPNPDAEEAYWQMGLLGKFIFRQTNRALPSPHSPGQRGSIESGGAIIMQECPATFQYCNRKTIFDDLVDEDLLIDLDPEPCALMP